MTQKNAIRTIRTLVAVYLLLLCAAIINGCASGGSNSTAPVAQILLDEDFVKIVGDSLELYIKDSDKAKAAQLILRLVVFIAKKINDSGDPAAAKALEDKAKAIPADPLGFDKAKALGQEAVDTAKAHVVAPAPVQPTPAQPAPTVTPN